MSNKTRLIEIELTEKQAITLGRIIRSGEDYSVSVEDGEDVENVAINAIEQAFDWEFQV